MADRVRIGILGGGGILGAHGPTYAMITGQCEIAAVAEPNPGRAGAIREFFGPDVRIEKDYADVVAMDDVDAVDILLPHNLHMPAAVAAAQAGKHVFVEKVMARNIYECDRMIEACEAAGVSLTVCHDRRYDGEWIALKQIVDSGALGEIYHWRLEHNQNVAPLHGDCRITWAGTRDGIGGGAIMSCLTHQIDALRWYGGEAGAITCMTKIIPDRMEGENIGVIIAQMKSGALAELSINWATRSNAAPNGLWYEMNHVSGEKGEAYYMSGKGTFLLLHGGGPVPPVEYEEPPPEGGFGKVKCDPCPGHEGCIREWVKGLRGEASAITTTGRDVRKTVEFAEAACCSAETGETVSLPITPKPWRT